MYQPKEGEPTQAVNDESAQSGESAESPTPATESAPAPAPVTATDTAGR
jgi:hypothetical protein